MYTGLIGSLVPPEKSCALPKPKHLRTRLRDFLQVPRGKSWRHPTFALREVALAKSTYLMQKCSFKAKLEAGTKYLPMVEMTSSYAQWLVWMAVQMPHDFQKLRGLLRKFECRANSPGIACRNHQSTTSTWTKFENLDTLLIQKRLSTFKHPIRYLLLMAEMLHQLANTVVQKINYPFQSSLMLQGLQPFFSSFSWCHTKDPKHILPRPLSSPPLPVFYPGLALRGFPGDSRL